MLLYNRRERILPAENARDFFDSLAHTVFGEERPEVINRISRNVLEKPMSSSFLSRRLAFIKERGLASLANTDGFIQTDFLLELGDCCLFLTGWFSEGLDEARDARGTGYFTGYGIRSYTAAMDTPGASQRRELIGAFADNFRDYSERLRVVSRMPPIRFK